MHAQSIGTARLSDGNRERRRMGKEGAKSAETIAVETISFEATDMDVETLDAIIPSKRSGPHKRNKRI